ncbi:MAG: HAD-IIA family hydrolase [Desulfobacteraceae bacterium]|jgi:HAD superfamily hydrolase (TIGR01450 family)
MQMYASFRDWLDKSPKEIDALVFDIDGVLLTRGKRNRGSKRLLNMLEKKEIPFILLTNDGNHSTLEKALSLQAAGIDLPSEKIVSCAHAITPLVDERNLKGQLFFIMGDLGSPCYAQTAGLRTTRNLDDLPSCSGVIVGEENYDWESTINAVVNFFIDIPQALLIIPNPDEFYPGHTGTIRLAAGSIGRFVVSALKVYGITISSLFLGKPYRPVFRMAHKYIEKIATRSISVDRVMMVGDNLHSDTQGAIDFGYRSAIVLTGVTNHAMLASSSIKPKFVFEQL